MKNKIILILILFSFLQSNLFGQKDTFDNNKYFKFIKHYKSKQELFDSGYTEFDLNSNKWYGKENIKRLQKKNKEFIINGFQYGFIQSPNKKYVFGYKENGDEETEVEVICFADTNGIIYKSEKLPIIAEINTIKYFTLNSNYVFLPLTNNNKILIYDFKGNLKYNIKTSFFIKSTDYISVSSDLNNYLYCNNYGLGDSSIIYFYNINNLLKYKITLKNNYLNNCEIFKNILISMVTEKKSFKGKNNKFNIIIVDKQKGIQLYKLIDVDAIYYFENKFLVRIGNKYAEYEILD